MSRWPSLAATLCVLAGGFGALALGTDGLTVWTAESARRQAVLEDPRLLPDFPLRDSRGELLSLIPEKGNLAVVDFIYTRCPGVCQAMGLQFRQLQGDLEPLGWLDQVELVSVTFDPANDDDAALNNYLRRYGAAEPYWRAARFVYEEHLAETLATMGVVVIPEPRMGFVHNAAFYLIDNGRVVEILDWDDRAGLLEAIRRRLEAGS